MSIKKKKPRYGYYGLPKFSFLIAIIMFIGIAVTAFVWQTLGILIMCFGFYAILSFTITQWRVGQSETWELPQILKLDGDEKVLDVGCGLGRMTISVAKRLKGERVIGIDIWDKMEILGNSLENAYANAEIEGVRDKVEFRTGNVLDLQFPENSFDLVTSSSVINNLHTKADKMKSLKEVFRVLKPGGKFLMIEPLRNLRNFFIGWTPLGVWMLLSRDAWTEVLEKAGFIKLKYSYQDGAGIFLVEKPLIFLNLIEKKTATFIYSIAV